MPSPSFQLSPPEHRVASMTAGSTRISVIGAVLGVVAVLLLLALMLGRGNEAPSTEEPEPAATHAQTPSEAPVERAAATSPFTDEDALDTIAREEEAAPFVAEQPPEETPAGLTGPGRIYGTVAMPGGAPVPEDMRVELHRYDSESAEVSYGDTLLETVAPGSEGGFDFEDLPLKSYALFATSDGYTMHTTATLTRARTERNVTLQVVPGGAIAGRVMNEADEPVAGAHVFTAAWNMGGQTSNAPRSRALASRVTTDDEGAFVMRNLRFGAPGEQGYRLAVKAEGYATYLSDYMLAGTQDVDLVLSFGGMIAGQLVHAETGEPATDKVVTLDSELAMENLSTTSDAEGWFFMTGVPAGSHRARLVDDELVVVPETARFDVAEGEQTTDILIEVAMGGRITGRVYDGETGAGIAGARLRAAPEGFSLTVTPSAHTDGQGRYEMKGLEPGAYSLVLAKPEGYPNNSPSRQDRSRTIMAKLDSETSGVDFELTKGIQIFGMVVDEEGRPLAQVTVNANVDRGNTSDYDRTQRDGSFAVAGFPPNVTVRISASKSGFTMESMEPEGGRVEIEEGSVTGVRFVMGPESSISGFVVDRFGNPKAGVQMLARKTESSPAGYPIERTSADGAFSFDRLSAGEYRIQFWKSGRSYNDMPSPAENIQLAKGEKITGLRLLYDEPEGLTITGRVTDSQGKAVPGASIRVVQGPSAGDAQTGTDGTYALTGLAEGTLTISAYSFRHSPSDSIRVAAGSHNVNFVLSSLAAIEGQVLSARTGAPITSFQVRAQKRGGTRYFVRDQFKAFSDPEGRFRLSEVEEGAATLTARAEGYAKAMADVKVIVGGDTVRGVVLRLEEGTELAGHVVNRSGVPISSAQIFLGPVPDEWQRDREALTRTNRDGEFKLTSLPAGNVMLSASHREYTPESVTLSLSRFSENRVEIVLLQGGVVEGYVTLNGVPQPGQNVSARTQINGRSKNVRTDADGHYSMLGLPDGTTRIQASLRVNDTFRNQSRQAEVADDMTTVVDFDFVPGSSAIEGTVYEDEVTPLRQQAYLFASIDVGGGVIESFSTQTRSNGTFVLEGLPAGLVSLGVSAPGFPAKKLDFELGARQTLHQDIFLFGGATIVCEMSGGNAGAGTIAVAAALSGVVDIPDLNMEFLLSLQQAIATQMQFENGVARLSGLEPGTYTILAIVYDQTAMEAAMEDGSDPLASAQWQTSVVEVGKDEIVSVSFSF